MIRGLPTYTLQMTQPLFFFFFNDTATTEIYTLSLHDALPISELWRSICTPSETAWLGSLPDSERLAAATLIFSAKEAFYKCQFALTQERIEIGRAHV